jgi:large repetitive protein
MRGMLVCGLFATACALTASCSDDLAPVATQNTGGSGGVGGADAGVGGTDGSVAGGSGTAGAGGQGGTKLDSGPEAGGGSWSATGSLAQARAFYFTTTVLLSGKVLVADGHTPESGAPDTATAELYDPATGAWTTAGSMTTKRASACAALLPSGKVLVAGGSSDPGVLTTAEIYDPTSNTWAPTTQPMASAHDLPACVVLASGKVLVSGGGGPTANAELYDPSTGIFTQTGSMATGRYWHTATVLDSGKVLVAGGCIGGYPCNTTLASSEVFDPATELWSPTGDLPGGVYGHTSTRLLSGKVLVAGGCSSNALCGPEGYPTGDASAVASLYDPNAGTWTTTGQMLQGHVGHQALLLASGDVLLVGGSYLSSASNNVTERYELTAGVWEYGPTPLVDHGTYFGSAKLQTGKWLVVAGMGPRSDTSYAVTDAAEIFTE